MWMMDFYIPYTVVVIFLDGWLKNFYDDDGWHHREEWLIKKNDFFYQSSKKKTFVLVSKYTHNNVRICDDD